VSQPPDHNANERLVLFSDAVIAITITLLVLEIRLPEGFGEFSNAELWQALVELGPRFLGYLISFAVIGVYWLNHHAKFGVIVKSSRGLLAINLLFLLFIGVVPFTTSLIAENGGALSTAIYAGGMVCCGLSLMWLWAYADARSMVDPSLSRERRLRLLLTTLLSSVVFALSIPLAFVNADLAKFFWLLIVPANLIGRTLVRSGDEA
jgi:uncharacterized membrane protein